MAKINRTILLYGNAIKLVSSREAEVTRNALHGVHWPIGNGKKLIIDYSTMEDMETAKNPPVVIFRKEITPEKENLVS